MPSDSVLQIDPVLRYLGQKLGLRSMKRLEDLLYEKAMSLRLDWFEYPHYYDGLQRAVEIMDEQEQSRALTQAQNVVLIAFQTIGVLVAFAAIHWSVPIAMAVVECRPARVPRNPGQERCRYRPLPDRCAKTPGVLGQVTDGTSTGFGGETLWPGRVRHIFMAQYDRYHGERESGSAPEGTCLLASPHCWLPWVCLESCLYPWSGQGTKESLRQAQWSAISTSLGAIWARCPSSYGGLALSTDLRRGCSISRSSCRLGRWNDVEGVEAPSQIRQGVSLHNVSFTYPGSNSPVLSEIDMEIRAGETVALIGENGAGKTTLTKLLLGLYEPTSGFVALDGMDLKEVDLMSWRDRTGAVFQDYVKYAFTARENIGMGRVGELENVSAIRDAGVRSGVHSAIEDLPRGYETLLGREFEGGRELSGGQWQSLAIARLYLRDADLLVLDEPTSALDPLAEVQVYHQFLELSSNKTVLLISHQLGSARLDWRIAYCFSKTDESLRRALTTSSSRRAEHTPSFSRCRRSGTDDRCTGNCVRNADGFDFGPLALSAEADRNSVEARALGDGICWCRFAGIRPDPNRRCAGLARPGRQCRRPNFGERVTYLRHWSG